MGWTFEFLIILGLVLLNGFFAGAEIAILTARTNRLEQAAQSGRKGAKLALQLAGNASRFLSTVQVGITVVATFAATYGGVNLVRQVSAQLSASTIPLITRNSQGIALVLVTGGISFLSLVLGELVPKRAALQRAESLAQFVAWPMTMLSVLARPVVNVLGFVTNLCLSVLRIKSEHETNLSIEDIQHLLQSGKQHGILEEAEHEVAMEALQLRDRRVTDIMRPRIDMDAADIDTPASEIIGAVAMSGFSRLPVYEKDVDHIVGFIYIKDVFQQFYLGREIDLRRILHPPLFIPETLTLGKLLVMFQQQKTQLAIVVDEFGGTTGLVTFEDILEELVGEIHDEYRRVDEQFIVQSSEFRWLVEGRVSMHDLVEDVPCLSRLRTIFPSVSTVAGLVMANSDRLPKVGYEVAVEEFTLEVVDMDGTRVDRVAISMTDPSTEDKPTDSK